MENKNTIEKGAAAEKVAADFYLGLGYRVLARNFRTPMGELDLVLWREGELVISEVKGRARFRGDEAWSPRWREKKRRLRRMAYLFLDRHESILDGDEDIRLEIVFVTQGRVSHRYEDEPFV
jgi:putative endonuclease